MSASASEERLPKTTEMYGALKYHLISTMLLHFLCIHSLERSLSASMQISFASRILCAYFFFQLIAIKSDEKIASSIFSKEFWSVYSAQLWPFLLNTKISRKSDKSKNWFIKKSNWRQFYFPFLHFNINYLWKKIAISKICRSNELLTCRRCIRKFFFVFCENRG